MKMLRVTVILSLLVLLLGSCCTQKRCERLYPPAGNQESSHDSVSVSDRDSVSYIPQDSSWLKAYLECDAHGKVLLKQIAGYEAGKNVSIPRVSIHDNVLTAECKVDSVEVYNRLYSKYSHSNKTTVKVYTKEVNKLTPLQLWMILLCKIESAILFLIIVYVLIKYYIKWQKTRFL
jgi:hypothetical protein